VLVAFNITGTPELWLGAALIVLLVLVVLKMLRSRKSDPKNHGAYDHITESFTVPEIVFVVRSAIENALQARQRAQRLPTLTN